MESQQYTDGQLILHNFLAWLWQDQNRVIQTVSEQVTKTHILSSSILNLCLAWVVKSQSIQLFQKHWVRSFSRPEKLPLKIHTGSSGLSIHTGWKKPYFFQIGQVLVVTCRVRMFLILADFSLNPEGGGGWGVIFYIE